MRPEGIIEGIISVFSVLWVFGIEEASHVSNHLDAEFAVEVDFSLVEGTHPHSYLDTHIIRNYENDEEESKLI